MENMPLPTIPGGVPSADNSIANGPGSPTTLSKRKKTRTPTPIVLLGLISGSVLLQFTFPWEKEQSSVLPDQEQRKLGDGGSYNVLEIFLAIFALISEFLRLL